MSTDAQRLVAERSHNCALNYWSKHKYGRAFAHFLVAFNLCPEWKDGLKSEFTSTLCQWGEKLEAKERYSDLFLCYEQALDLFPENEELLNNFGAHLFRLGHVAEAAAYFHRALRMNPEYLPARDNLQNARNSLLEQWHFPMLNDQKRNSAFREAIHQKVAAGWGTMLDIGTGTGLLSMFGVEAGAHEVYACDMSSTMIQVAREVLRHNNMSDQVQLIHKQSTDLKVPGDLKTRVALVVTETLDAGLLGEHILETLSHAWNFLLLPPVCLPRNYPEADSLRKDLLKECGEKHHKESDSLDGILSNTKGLVINNIEKQTNGSHNALPSDLGEHSVNTDCQKTDSKSSSSVGGAVVPAGATLYVCLIECGYIAKQTLLQMNTSQNLNFFKLNVNLHCREPYTSEHLNNVPGGYRKLTEPQIALNLDFNNPKEINFYLHTGSMENIEMYCLESGRVDAVAMWFTLHVSRNISLSTDPGSGGCWEQAVFPVKHELYAAAGDVVIVPFSCKKCVTIESPVKLADNRKTELKQTATPPEATSAQMVNRSENLASQYPKEYVHMPSTHLVCNHEDCRLPVTSGMNLGSLCLTELEISLLNEPTWVGAISSMVNYMPSLGCSLSVLDGNPFPLAGLQMLSAGVASNLTCISDDRRLKKAVLTAAAASGIKPSYVKFITSDQLEDEQPWDVVTFMPVDRSGILAQEIISLIPVIKNCLVSRSSIMLPWKLCVFAQLIWSPQLIEMSQVVSDERLCGFTVTQFINLFQVSQQLELTLSTLQHTTLSSSVKVLEIDFTKASEQDSNTGTDITRVAAVEVTQTGTVTAIPFWFQMDFGWGVTVSTLKPDCHYWKQAAFLCNPGVQVSAGQQVGIQTRCQNGTLDLKLLVDEA